jgi:hypothetical protein
MFFHCCKRFDLSLNPVNLFVTLKWFSKILLSCLGFLRFIDNIYDSVFYSSRNINFSPLC